MNRIKISKAKVNYGYAYIPENPGVDGFETEKKFANMDDVMIAIGEDERVESPYDVSVDESAYDTDPEIRAFESFYPKDVTMPEQEATDIEETGATVVSPGTGATQGSSGSAGRVTSGTSVSTSTPTGGTPGTTV